jgi:hypothetical protein
MVPTHNRDSVRARSSDDIPPVFYEIIKPRKYCRGGGGLRQVLGSTGCDTTRVDAFCASSEVLRLRSVRSSSRDSGGDEMVRMMFEMVQDG